MISSWTSAGLCALLLICLLIGYEFVSFDRSQISAAPLSEQFGTEILEEIRNLETEINEIKRGSENDVTPLQPVFDQEEFFEDFSAQFLELVEKKLPELVKAQEFSPRPEPELPAVEPEVPQIEPVVAEPLVYKKWKKIPLVDRVGEFKDGLCEKKEKIYFLKTSKTGSTTMANILIRFGFQRPGTNFLLGESPNGAMFFLNGYMPFNENLCYMGRDIANRPKFDISYVHMRYDRHAIDEVMHPDIFKVSILRDPLDNFISSWKYYNGLTKEMRAIVNADIKPKLDWTENPDWFKEIEQFLTKPWDYLKTFPYSHSAYLFTVNPQLIFFGYPSYLLQNTVNRLQNLVDNWIHNIEEDFDHIIILEDLDRSLAVLMLKLCWDIEDVVHLKLNSMKKDGKTLNAVTQKRLKDFNWADYRMYNYFKTKLDAEITKIGAARVEAVAERIKKRAEEVSAECLQPDKTTGWISSPIIKPEKRRNQTCHMYVKDITGWVEAEQMIRWKKEYPTWRLPKTSRLKKRGKNMPNMCSPTESFGDWIAKKDKDFREFLTWETDENDFRNYVPDYLKDFTQPLTQDEEIREVLRIFN